MSVVVIVNFKGGVAKSTVTANAARGFAKRLCEMLVIDFDLQGDTSNFLRKSFTVKSNALVSEESAPLCQERNQIHSAQVENGQNKSGQISNGHSRNGYVSNAQINNGQINNGLSGVLRSIIEPVGGGVDLLSLKTFEQKFGKQALDSLSHSPQLLHEVIEDLGFEYDYVLIDTAPVPNSFHNVAIEAADLCIVPVDPSEMSVRAAGRTVDFIAKTKAVPVLLLRTLMSKAATRILRKSTAELSEPRGNKEESIDASSDTALPRRVRMKVTVSAESESLPLYLAHHCVFRSEQIQRLSYEGKTVFECSGMESIREQYEGVITEIEVVLGNSDSEKELPVGNELASAFAAMT